MRKLTPAKSVENLMVERMYLQDIKRSMKIKVDHQRKENKMMIHQNLRVKDLKLQRIMNVTLVEQLLQVERISKSTL